MTRLLRSATFGLLATAFAAFGAPSLPARADGVDAAVPRAVVFMYSRFGDDAYPASISIDQFEAHLQELKAGGYTVRPLPEIIQALRDNRPLPEGTVAITIDEAYASVYAEAWPRLRRAGLPFTIFVATDAVDRGPDNGFMSWSQIREMTSSGLATVGNMTASHPHLVEEDRAYVIGQIQRASQRIEAELGTKPTLFAYPYGEYDAELEELIEGQGFVAAFGQQSGVVNARADRYGLPRFTLNDAYGSTERFRLAAQALPLYVSDLTPEDGILDEDDNPPSLGFTVDPMVGDISSLACFASGIGRIKLETVAERRVEARLAEKLPSGRVRINCTLPAAEGRWRWFGLQFSVP